MKGRYCKSRLICRILVILTCTSYTGDGLAQEVRDTIMKTVQIGPDSLEIRKQFIRDSTMAREQFVRDSLQHRQHVHDSLIFLQHELKGLLEAYCRTVRDDIFFRDYEIELTGDSVLGEYSFLILPFSVTQPFTPWKVRYDLTGKSMKISIDSHIQRITSIQSSAVRCSFTWGNSNSILVLNEQSVVQKNSWGQFYTTPVDSVFFDRFRRITRIKKYVQVYAVVNGNQRGVPLFLNLTYVKQYQYGPDQQPTGYQIVKFCDRWTVQEKNRVCSIINFTFSVQGNTLKLTRHNDPANNYSDGTYTYEFDDHDNLKSISFQNLAKTENWQRTIELNGEGNVHCYFDLVQGIIQQSLCMIYHSGNPNAKQGVETITTTFEKDGISYFQRNNTTGQSRTRDRMTLEWSPWK
jgi:hypothetical protein